jgi:hypothetical protein
MAIFRLPGRALRAIRPVHLAVVAAVLFGAGGVAVAATSSGSRAVIHACASRTTGALRIRHGRSCGSGARAVTWNRRGQAGPAGATGATGPRGATGATGARGAAGATGATGAKGTAGTPGTKGTTGSPGPAGPPAPSATAQDATPVTLGNAYAPALSTTITTTATGHLVAQATGTFTTTTAGQVQCELTATPQNGAAAVIGEPITADVTSGTEPETIVGGASEPAGTYAVVLSCETAAGAAATVNSSAITVTSGG